MLTLLFTKTNKFCGENITYPTEYDLSIDRTSLKDSYWNGCHSSIPIFNYQKNKALEECNALSNYLNYKLKSVNKEYEISCGEKNELVVLQFDTPFICKHNIDKVNHILFNGYNKLNCGHVYYGATTENTFYTVIVEKTFMKHIISKNLSDA